MLLEETHRIESRKVSGAPHDEAVDAVAIDVRGAAGGIQQNVDLRMLVLELADAPHQPRRGEGGAGADDDEVAAPRLAHAPRGGGDAGKTLLEVAQPGLAGVGQRQPAAGFLDERRADLRLEQAHLLGHGGFGDVQVLRGLGEAEVLGDRFESAQRVEGGKPMGHVDDPSRHRRKRRRWPAGASQLCAQTWQTA